MKCSICEVNEAAEWSDYCAECEAHILLTLAAEDYRNWVMTQEFHADYAETDIYTPATSYHTCIRCGELVPGVNASILHFERKHAAKVYPDGIPFRVVAV